MRLFQSSLYRKFYLLIVSSLLLTGSSLFAADVIKTPKAPEPEQVGVELNDLKRHIDFLASDTLEGRESGSRGGKAAGTYIVSELMKYGLQPAGASQSYYQEFGQGYRNILAVIPGSDPELASEYVMLGAHYDHVGYGNRTNSLGPIGQIHNGADDNASGTSLTLEIAQGLSQLKQKPKRSVIFVFWDAEERGLLGSQHWCNNPTVDLSKVRFYFNYDMVGHLTKNDIETYGVRTMAQMQRFLVQNNQGYDLNLTYIWDNKRESDHYPFYQKNIPYLMLHTGKHYDYHRPTDDVDKVNMDGLFRITQYSGRLLTDMANRDNIADFRSEARRENEVQHKFQARKSVFITPRLGMTWKRPESASNVIEITSVNSDSPAQIAGLKPGDLIYKIGKQEIDATDFRTLVMKSENKTTLRVSRPPSEEKTNVEIELKGSPQLLGTKLRFDLAEPGAPIITYVTPGSPADYAKLQKEDVIWSLNGVWPETETAFFQELGKIGTAALKMTLVIERHGQLEELSVNLWPQAVELSE